jgi:PAS domain S-box-containing protein
MFSSANIMVVEDEQIVAKDLELNLKRLGHSVPAIASSGEEAVQKAESVRPDLIFMDIRLDGEMDGVEAARRIKQNRPVPVVYLSAYADEATLNRAMDTEPYGYLLKPFQANQIRTTVQLALRKHATEQAMRDTESRNAAIVAAALDCIITVDHEGRILEFNPAAERTFGHPREQILGRPLAETIIPPAMREQHSRGWDLYLQTGQGPMVGRRMEISALRADGSEFPVELAVTRINRQGPPVFTAHLRDITQRKASEQDMANLIKGLQDALHQVKTLSGLIPICTRCKKIRDDRGYWHQLESYLRDRSNASFTHSYCPDCADVFRKEFLRDEKRLGTGDVRLRP